MDARALRRVRSKTRVLLTRFLARALLCPVYSREWLDARPKGVLCAICAMFFLCSRSPVYTREWLDARPKGVLCAICAVSFLCSRSLKGTVLRLVAKKSKCGESKLIGPKK